MKYLVFEDYLKPSVNIQLAGLTQQQEEERLKECTRFIKQINEHLHFDNRILCTAIVIFCIYTRKHTFFEFNQYIACGMAHFIAAKIEYKHAQIEFYERFAHEKQPMPKPIKGKTIKVVMFESVQEQLHKEAMRVELDMLTAIQFDFEYSFPFSIIRNYLGRNEDVALKLCLDTVYLNNPHKGYFLYYPPCHLAAAILTILLGSKFSLE